MSNMRCRVFLFAAGLLTACGSEEEKVGATMPQARAEQRPVQVQLAPAEEELFEEPLEEIEEEIEESVLTPGDGPFESDSFNEVIGVGGGAGGRYCGRSTAQGAQVVRIDGASTESYAPIVEPGFNGATREPLSTFSIDVDTASYANVRRCLQAGFRPPKDAVRIEELLNRFRYDYPVPREGEPFSVATEVASCPWAPEHRLVHVGIRAAEVDLSTAPAANLVFLIDVSGSMQDANKLRLLVKGMRMLVEHLNDRDRVAIVVYAGASGLVLPSTPCTRRSEILAALDALEAGGSTNGGAGIELAYGVALENYVAEGVNRVLLATDGDFNVGISDRGALKRLIEEKAATGVFLTVLGFGTGNLKDDRLETLADSGNGHYVYVDGLHEARKVLVEELGGTLVTVAKDVKIQVEFNPAEVAAWRLIGYENRVLAHTDFKDDTKDAGEIGAGHTVTALYEVVPAGGAVPEHAELDPLRYQTRRSLVGSAAGELLTLRLRWKAPDEDVSVGTDTYVLDDGATWYAASDDFRFAASVAAFGMTLRESELRGSADLALALELAREGLGEDARGYRGEYVRLVERAREE